MPLPWPSDRPGTRWSSTALVTSQRREEVATLIRADGGTAMVVAASVADRQQRQVLLDRAREAYGDLHVLVNNAGITSPGRQDLLEATEENWDVVFDTNLKGPFFLTQLAATHMVAARQAGRIDRATIVNISSISAFTVSTNRADYCLTKAALHMMTQLFASAIGG